MKEEKIRPSPCRTPALIRNGSDISPIKFTLEVVLVTVCLMRFWVFGSMMTYESALRVISAIARSSSRLVSSMPIDLLALERKFVSQRKSQTDGYTAPAGKLRCWEQEERDRWTKRLIKRVKPWVDRNGEINYYLTQLVTGHVYFLSYMRKVENRGYKMSLLSWSS